MGSWPWICDFTNSLCGDGISGVLRVLLLVSQMWSFSRSNCVSSSVQDCQIRSLVGREEGMTCVALSVLLPLGIHRVLHGWKCGRSQENTLEKAP